MDLAFRRECGGAWSVKALVADGGRASNWDTEALPLLLVRTYSRKWTKKIAHALMLVRGNADGSVQVVRIPDNGVVPLETKIISFKFVYKKGHGPYIIPKHGFGGPNAADLTTVGIGVERSWSEACRILLRATAGRDYTVNHSCTDQVNGSGAVVLDVVYPVGRGSLPRLERGGIGKKSQSCSDEEGRELESHSGEGG